MRRSLFTLSLAVAAVSLAGCSDSFDPVSQGRLRVVHASPNAPNVDVRVDGDRIASNLPYTEATSYRAVDAGSRSITVSANGSSTNVITANLPVVANTDYTVLAANLISNIEPVVLTDNNTAPATGQFKLRLVHGAPSAPNVDIYITGPSVDITGAVPDFANVAFKGVTPYVAAPAGDYRVRITVAGTKDVAIDTGTLSLSAGQVRTAIARDASGSGAPFGVILLADVN